MSQLSFLCLLISSTTFLLFIYFMLSMKLSSCLISSTVQLVLPLYLNVAALVNFACPFSLAQFQLFSSILLFSYLFACQLLISLFCSCWLLCSVSFADDRLCFALVLLVKCSWHADYNDTSIIWQLTFASVWQLYLPFTACTNLHSNANVLQI